MTTPKKENKNAQQSKPVSIEILDCNGQRRMTMSGTNQAELENEVAAEIARQEIYRPHMAPYKWNVCG